MRRVPRFLAIPVVLAMLAGLVTVTTGPAAAFVAPAIDGVSTQSGPTGGGTPVRIIGANFTGATAVKFGTVTVATNKWHFVDDNLITAVAPVATVSNNTLVHVTVTANSLTNTLSSSDYFFYTNATLTLSKSTGLANNEAITVTLTGYQPNTQVVIPEFNPLLLYIEQFVDFPTTPPNPPYVAPLWTGTTDASGNVTHSVNVLSGSSFTGASGGLGYDAQAVCPVNQTTANYLGNPSTLTKYEGHCMIGVNGAGGSFGQGTLELPIRFAGLTEKAPAAPILNLSATSAAHGSSVNIATGSKNWNANSFFGSTPTFTNPGETRTVVNLCGFTGGTPCSTTVVNNVSVALTDYVGAANPGTPPPTIVGQFSGATASGSVTLNGPGPFPCTCTVELDQYRPDGSYVSATKAITVT